MELYNEDFIDINEAKTLHGLFQIRVSRDPNGIAYRYFDKLSRSWQEYSWQQALEQINRYRSALIGAGLKKGQSVGIMLRNCPEWIFMEQACMAQGIISVPLYPNDRPDNVSYIINEAEIQLILIEDQDQFSILQEAKNAFNSPPSVISIINISKQNSEISCIFYEDWLDQHTNQTIDESFKDFDSKSLATIVYTSGTTGRPKGVMLSHWNILSNVQGGVESITVYKEDLFLSFLPLSHTLERTVGLYIPIISGATVAFAQSVAHLADDLLTIRPTILISVPRIFERVYGKIQIQLESKSSVANTLFQLTESIGWERFEYQQGRGKKSWRFLLWPLLNKLVAKKLLDKLGGRLRFAISGGAPLPDVIGHLFIAFGLPILQGYGLTETSPIISVNKLKNNKPTSIGPTLNGIEVRLDDKMELQTKSESVMLGYWKNEQATKEMFTEDGWLKTGDLAKIEDGRIYITGRLKEILVLSNGEKVPPVDMEIAICLHPLFEQALVIGESKPYLSAIVVLDPEQWEKLAKNADLNPELEENLQNSQIKKQILSKLCGCLGDFPGYAQVRQITLSIIPWTDENHFLTPSLKLRRKIILENFADDIKNMYKGH